MAGCSTIPSNPHPNPSSVKNGFLLDNIPQEFLLHGLNFPFHSSCAYHRPFNKASVVETQMEKDTPLAITGKLEAGGILSPPALCAISKHS